MGSQRAEIREGVVADTALRGVIAGDPHESTAFDSSAGPDGMDGLYLSRPRTVAGRAWTDSVRPARTP